MLLETLRVDGLLSFAPGTPALELRPLNVVIGPNGSGKSNLVEAIELLRATPTGFAAAIRDGGGVREWLWKAASDAPGTIETRLARAAQGALRYQLSFTAAGAHTEIVDEIIEDAVQVDPEASGPYFYYQFRGGRPTLNVRGEGDAEPRPRTLPPESLAVDESVLSQRKDPETYPELSWCASQFARIQTFREWSFGRYSAVRQPQPADLPADVLLPDARNLGLLLNQLEHGDAASELNALVRRFLPRFKRVTTLVQAGTVQFFLHEDGLKKPVPAARLSDGTLRFLAMTALLVMPTPPPLICIEEPELSGSTPTRLRSWPSSSSRRAPERRSS